MVIVIVPSEEPTNKISLSKETPIIKNRGRSRDCWVATVSSTRVSKFISDEQVRNLRQSSIIRSQDGEDLMESFEDSFLDSCSHEGDDEEGDGLEEPPFPSPLQYLRSPEIPQVTLQNIMAW